jgi:tetratricopeptide (TPR) repeat protein
LTDRLRPLFDLTDLPGTEKRLRAALAAETTDTGRAEVLTQLARVASWLDRFEEARALLDEADALAGDAGVARARVLVERGRLLRRTEGDPVALPLLEAGYEAALGAGAWFVAADAAHSCALAGDMELWTSRGLEVADGHESARYWRGTLLVNLADWHFARGEHEESLAVARAALAAREQETRSPSVTEEARFAVGRALRALGRPDEAIPLLEQAVRWADESRWNLPEAADWRAELGAAGAEASRQASGRTTE